jgi:hypothetical protein
VRASGPDVREGECPEPTQLRSAAGVQRARPREALVSQGFASRLTRGFGVLEPSPMSGWCAQPFKLTTPIGGRWRFGLVADCPDQSLRNAACCLSFLVERSVPQSSCRHPKQPHHRVARATRDMTNSRASTCLRRARNVVEPKTVATLAKITRLATAPRLVRACRIATLSAAGLGLAMSAFDTGGFGPPIALLGAVAAELMHCPGSHNV